MIFFLLLLITVVRSVKRNGTSSTSDASLDAYFHAIILSSMPSIRPIEETLEQHVMDDCCFSVHDINSLIRNRQTIISILIIQTCFLRSVPS